MPINIDNAHWVLVHIDVDRKLVSYRDSFRGYDAVCARNLAQFMCDLAQETRGLVWDVNDWACGKPDDALIPEQSDGNSCGAFVLESAKFLVRLTGFVARGLAFHA